MTEVPHTIRRSFSLMALALLALRQAPWVKLAAKRLAEFKLLPARSSTGAG